MMMLLCNQRLLLVLFLSTTFFCAKCEIHRVKPHSSKRIQPFKERRHEERSATEHRVTVQEDEHVGRNDEDKISHTESCVYALIATILVGLSGVFPLLLPFDTSHIKEGKEGAGFRCLLAFAVGGLLGDVFLHLLPEAWAHINLSNDGSTHLSIGLWVLFGLLSFMILEKILSDEIDNRELEKLKYSSEQSTDHEDISTTTNGSKQVAVVHNRTTRVKSKHTANGQKKTKNGFIKGKSNKKKNQSPPAKIQVTGYLNLFANFIDNFTHGLAVAGSFLVSKKVGIVTTFAIMLHEIPHEIGDFAILLRSGFDRKSAAKNQVMTATGGMLGAVFALASDSAEGVGSSSAWVLPFTSGGFLFISLVTIVPELLEEKNARESLKQTICLCIGIAVMYLVSYFH
ncbi:zinc transporter ZIP13-like [Antedon mediterranea]|uniref:zinc transporter ZIP13-like n=1 Tax=Antedon mediterranea TaxID=105859 RepID=UPI003AF7EF7A